jgi:uncharacterized protein (TIGR03067 family)
MDGLRSAPARGVNMRSHCASRLALLDKMHCKDTKTPDSERRSLMRHLPFLTAMAVLLLGFINTQAGEAKKGGGAKQDQDKLQGTWEATEVVINGMPVPAGERKGITFVFSGDKMTLAGPGGIGKREFKFKLDPTKKPRAIDTVPQDGPFKGKSGPAIYELKGDTLKLCIPNQATNERPKEFESTKGANLGLFVLKRAKE